MHRRACDLRVARDLTVVQHAAIAERRNLQETADRRNASRQPFVREKTKYYASQVIEDVYHQTGAQDDLRGGFVVTRYRAR